VIARFGPEWIVRRALGSCGRGAVLRILLIAVRDGFGSGGACLGQQERQAQDGHYPGMLHPRRDGRLEQEAAQAFRIAALAFLDALEGDFKPKPMPVLIQTGLHRCAHPQ
jgi:hypothetical protein